MFNSRPSTGGSARTSTPAITHCTVPTTTSATPPASTNTTTPTVSTPPSVAVPPTVVNAPKGKAPSGRISQRSSAADTSSGSSNPIQLSDLQSFLQGISTAPSDQQSGKEAFV